MIYPKKLGTRSALKRLLSFATLSITMYGSPVFSQQEVPQSAWNLSAPLYEEGNWQVSKGQVIATLPLADKTRTRIPIKLSGHGIQQSLIQGADGNEYKFRITATYSNIKLNDEQFKLDTLVSITLAAPGDPLDAGTIFKGYYNLSPSPLDYRGDERKTFLDNWDKRPQASQTPMPLDIIVNGGRFEMWLNGHYIGGGSVESPASLQLKLSGAAIGKTTTWPVPDKKFVPVDLNKNSRGRNSFTFSTPQLQPDKLQTIDSVPFQIASSDGSIDIGTSHWPRPLAGDGFKDPYYSRSSFDFVPESILLSVPSDDYSHAHLLCAVDPDPEKAPVLTLRLSRFSGSSVWGGGRGDGIADSFIRLEKTNGKWPEGVREMGTIKGKDKEGKEVSMPLLGVTVPIRSGEIPDVIDGGVAGLAKGRSNQYLDLELTRELFPAQPSSYASFTLKPQGKPSSINVLGLTLERADIKVRDGVRQIGNIFYNTEKAGYNLKMENRSGQKFAGKLSWQLTDYYGKTRDGSQKVHLDDKAEETIVSLDLPDLDLGWYRADLTLSDSNNKVVWQQPTSLAVLVPDTRKAGLDSPFGTWWFRDGHGGTSSVAEVAPLLKRMGVPHVTPGGAQREESGAEFAKHGLGVSMLPWSRESDLEKKKEAFDKYVQRYPNTKYAMIFHETGFGGGYNAFPPEFTGGKTPELSADAQKSFNSLMAATIPFARYIRQKYPHLKLIVGNGGSTFAYNLMRYGYPKDLVDYWGDETAGQSTLPESFGSNEWYYFDQLSKKYGYNKPVTACYEWRTRGTNPGNLTEMQQAQFYVRDVLMALAFSAPTITPGMLYDVGDMYYYSRWGSGGFLRRYPLLNPKISYVAMAVLTQQLDQAKYIRTLRTNSPSLYVLEFQRGGMWTYAMWVPRGKRQTTLSFATKAGNPALVDMNGRSIPVTIQSEKATIEVSDSPLYFHTGVRLSAVTGENTFIEEPPTTPVIADPMADISNWKIIPEPDVGFIENYARIDFIRKKGDATLVAATDPQKGQVLELRPQLPADNPIGLVRYVELAAVQPKEIPGEPTHVGVWVKGNSNFGRIMFEVKDAKGRSFYSKGGPAGGWNLLDWRGRFYNNFDGWNYISAKLPRRYDDKNNAPQVRDWFLLAGTDQSKDPVFPLRFTKILVELRNEVIQVNQTTPVPNPNIQFYGAGGY